MSSQMAVAERDDLDEERFACSSAGRLLALHLRQLRSRLFFQSRTSTNPESVIFDFVISAASREADIED